MARTEIEIIKDRKVVGGRLWYWLCFRRCIENRCGYLLQKLKISKLLQKNYLMMFPSSPSGVLFMWSGQASTIPSGFKLCDGNGTPDLRDRFIVGVSASGGYNPAATGGSNQVTLTEAQLAVHQHGITSNGTTNILLVVVRQTKLTTTHMVVGHHVKIGNHTHNGSTDPGGNHAHPPVGQVGFDN